MCARFYRWLISTRAELSFIIEPRVIVAVFLRLCADPPGRERGPG